MTDAFLIKWQTGKPPQFSQFTAIVADKAEAGNIAGLIKSELGAPASISVVTLYDDSQDFQTTLDVLAKQAAQKQIDQLNVDDLAALGLAQDVIDAIVSIQTKGG